MSSFDKSENVTYVNSFKQAVGGRPPRYAPAHACNGSPQRQP